jgi:SAM-dependent methyltransferase
MIKKIYYFYKSRGIVKTLKQILKSICSRIGITIIFQDRKIVRDIAKSRKIFSNRNLVFNQDGFWHLEPMPSKKELFEYYHLNYWGSIQPNNYGLKLRDLRHFAILNKVDPNFNSSKKKILNFGAGHGGVSIIFNILGHNVTNVEPSSMMKLFEKNWNINSSIDEVENENFDLIYGSHSLEHVSDLNAFNNKIKKLSNEKTIFFWEVPNGEHSKCGPQENRIDIPHTYYFTKKYFYNQYKKIILSDCYNSNLANIKLPFDFKSSVDKDGDCLVVIAKDIV